MEDVIEIHKKVCPHFQKKLDFSLDGIQECKSSSLSADVYSVSFHGCRTVYPVRIIRPINKFKVDDQHHIRQVLDDINENECLLDTAVGDNPKRSRMRCALAHGSSNACEYCEGKAVYITDISGKKKGQLAWPASTADAPLRTLQNIIEITEKLKNGEDLTRDERKGFWGTSHFLYQNNFHFIEDIPAEYMHSACIGGGKRLVELTFNVGETRDRVTKRKLSDAADFNQKMSLIKVFREFSRRIRNLDFGVFKAQEFRNIILFFFIIVVDCIPNDCTREKKIWFQLAYILRACILPNNEFEKVQTSSIHNSSKAFYKNYEAVYGPKNCTYSIHLIANHILQIKGNKPLTSKSAFKYENFYSELRNLFQPGTISPSKQILTNCYMKRQLENHNCEKSIFYDTEKSGRENNSLIYIMNENNEYELFNIIEIIDENNFLCNPQGKFEYKCDQLKELNWSNVGVFQVGPYSEEEIVIQRKNIAGKVLKINGVFITCPNNVLREQ